MNFHIGKFNINITCSLPSGQSSVETNVSPFDNYNLFTFEQLLINSSRFEECNIKKKTINDVKDYMSNTRVPNIFVLYMKLFNTTKCFRDSNDKDCGFVGIFKRATNTYEEFYNIGLNPDYIPDLQELVDWYYNLKCDNDLYKIIGFACYLLYEHIHPHYDGNGRMGRLLFLENVYNKCYVPISHKILNRRRLHDNLFPENVIRIYHDQDVNEIYSKQDVAKYYSITIDDDMLHKILLLLRE